MGYKKRPKNKQELNPFSGVTKKRKKTPPAKKVVVTFGFSVGEKKYGNGTGRIKVSTNGSTQCLIPHEDKWLIVKGVLDFIKMKTVTKLKA